MPIEEMRALWHPTRASILESLKSGPASRLKLTEEAGAPFAEVAYHCRALCSAGYIRCASSSGPNADDPVYEIV